MIDKQLDKNEEEKQSEIVYLTDRIVLGGAIAINVVILQDLISLQKLDSYLHTAILAIATALPLLIGSFVLNDMLVNFDSGRKWFEYKGVK